MNTILKVDRLSKSYRSGDKNLTVLKDVSFELQEGETCAIVGPSGSGKTTLLGLCAGLDLPSSGAVLLNGTSLAVLDEDARARFRSESVGFVFQNFQLIPTLTTLENVMVPLELRGATQVKPQAEKLLQAVGLGERMHHYPIQLSGGEQQRVALARAFINRPRVLFADEPTGNLDAETSERIERLLFDLNDANGTTLVMATHNIDLASRTDRIIRLAGGMMTADQAPQAQAAVAPAEVSST